MTLREAWNLRREREAYHATLPDEVAALIPSDAPVWKNLIGTEVEVGFRFQYEGDLYKVIQGDANNKHTFQSYWKPNEAVSLYVKVAPAGAGTRDNPIHYTDGMELEEGKYYEEDGILYYCNESLARSNWTLYVLANNVQRYVEVVE